MIKGVNKNIIEISSTGNDCFERAILFIRDGNFRDEKELSAKAGDYLSGLRLRRGFYRGGGKWFFAAIILSAAIGVAVTAAFFLLL